jgi:hypothetical protein
MSAESTGSQMLPLIKQWGRFSLLMKLWWDIKWIFGEKSYDDRLESDGSGYGAEAGCFKLTIIILRCDAVNFVTFQKNRYQSTRRHTQKYRNISTDYHENSKPHADKPPFSTDRCQSVTFSETLCLTECYKTLVQHWIWKLINTLRIEKNEKQTQLH